MKESKRASASRRLALAVMLALVCLLLTACYMEPDRVVDGDNGLSMGDNAQSFDTVITPTPTVTITPTPAPTTSAVDWSEWDFGADTATNPPTQVLPTAGSVVIPTQAPSIITATVGQTATATPRPTTSTSSSTTTSGVTTLKLGSEGADVKRMQQQLKNLGYYTGSVDGDFGAGTETAVRDFQANNGLSVDGKAGKRTLEVLYSGNARKKTATSVTAKPSSSSSSSSSVQPTQNTATMYTNGKTDIYLRLGSSGSQVKILQNRLIVLGYLTGTADGDFNETTEAGVKAFQKRHDIWDDGVAGPTTLSLLYSSSAKKASSAAGHLGSLKEGAVGDSVRTLQKNLRTLGFYTGSVDGDYGAGTTAAVLAFQQSRGLTADGVAGKATLNAIQAALGGGSSSSGSTSSGSKDSPENYGITASSNGYSSLSASSSSSKRNEITALQSALSATGYYRGSVDGSYGGGTTEAVEKYQRSKGLRVTGVAGPSTQRLLYGGTSESGSYSKLELGDSGSAVKRLQYALYELKYYDGNITGKYDTATENAVMAFQEVNGLYIDGVAGQDTQRRLFSSNAKPSNI